MEPIFGMERTVSQTEVRRWQLLAWSVVAVVALITLAVICAYVFKFKHLPISNDTGEWGSFGDFVGGLVNPLVGVGTVSLLVISIQIQRIELRSTLESARISYELQQRQSFEQSIFSWLTSYAELLSQFDIASGKTGRRALSELHENNFHFKALAYFWATDRDSNWDNARLMLYREMKAANKGGSTDKIEDFLDEASAAFFAIFQANRSGIDVSFECLKNLLLWIDSLELPLARRWHYIGIVNSHISWVELVFLFHIGIYDNSKVIPTLVNKYAFFERLKVNRDDVITLAREFVPHMKLKNSQWALWPWPYENTAFDSELASAKLQIASERLTPREN